MNTTAHRAAVAAFERTEAILDALLRAVVVSDSAGVIIGWNAAAEALYGWSPDEAIGSSARVVVMANNGDADTQIRAQALSGETWQGDVSVLRRNGEPARVFAVVSPLRDLAGRVLGTVMTADDVTEQRELERYAAELADHFRLALEAGELGTWRWDLASGVTTWDPQVERLFGLHEGEFNGTYDAWVRLIHPDDVDQVLARLEAAIAEKSHYLVDHRVVWPDGSVHWIQGRGKVTLDSRGHVSGTIGCTADITARKLAEAEAEQRARDAAAAADRERLQRERLQFLTELSDAALSSNDHREFMSAVTSLAVPKLGDWCALGFLPEPNLPPLIEVGHASPDKVTWARELVKRYPFDPNAQMGLAAVMRSGKAEFVPWVTKKMVDAARAESSLEADEFSAIADALQLTSVITVPLQTKRGVLGAMQFVSAESKRQYEAADLALAQAAAGRIAEALDNMWLVDQQRHIAATLQAALLPAELPRIPGIEIAVRYWPAGAAVEVGGDFYDLFEIGDSKWAVVIGDVCGTGPDGAALTGIARHTIRAAARHGQDHRGVLEWLNEAVLQSNLDLFCTGCYATLETKVDADGLWSLTSISGGHPFPIVVRPHQMPESVGVPGTLLGTFDQIRTTPVQTTVRTGDTIVFYTDGVTDLPPPHTLTSETAAELFAKAADRSTAEDVAEAIREILAENLPMADRNDDIALIVLKVTDTSL